MPGDSVVMPFFVLVILLGFSLFLLGLSRDLSILLVFPKRQFLAMLILTVHLFSLSLMSNITFSIFFLSA